MINNDDINGDDDVKQHAHPCDYFWCLLNKIGWCTWGTRPFAHRVIVGSLCGLHIDSCFFIIVL